MAAIARLKDIVGEKEVIVVPVHAEEFLGRNMIPVAVATIIARQLGAETDLDIVQATKVSRSGGDGWYRLANPPRFDGILNNDKHVIIVDDTQTQGGTFAALKGHIETTGQNNVIAAYALTGKQYSAQLGLNSHTLVTLRSKYGTFELWWKITFGYGFCASLPRVGSKIHPQLT